MTTPRDVRRCAQCGQAAAVCVKAWGSASAVLGVPIGPTSGVAREDFLCQACGVGFALESPAKRRFLGCLGLMFVGLLGPFALLMGLLSLLKQDPAAPIVVVVGLFFTGVEYLVWRWMDAPARVHRQNPVVPNAPPPTLRFHAPEPPARRCSCGAAARCVGVTDHQARGVSQGTETKHRCDACGREFSIDSVRGLVTLAVGVVVFVAIGVGLLVSAPGQGWGAWTCAGVVTLFGAAGALALVAALVGRVRHPTTAPGR